MQIKDIQQLELRRSEAMIQADEKALADLLADDLVWTHSSARVDSKQDFIASLAAGDLKYERIVLADQVIRVHGTVAVVTGLAEMSAVVKGAAKELCNRYTAVWEHAGASWQMVAWQSTPAQPAAAT